MKSIGMQDAYPSQAEGGLAGDISASLKRALNAWDQKRWDSSPKRMPSMCIRRAKTPKREEVSWNPKPQVLLEKRIKVPRDPKPKTIREPRIALTPEEARRRNAERNRLRRNGMTPAQRAQALEKRRAEYLRTHPIQRPVGRQISEEKRVKMRESSRKWKAKQKAKRNEHTTIIPS